MWTEIEHRIVVGDLAAGAPLDEAGLATELGADPTVVREALTRLERDGFVCSDGADAFAVCELDEAELREAYPIALLLEGMAVRSTDYDGTIIARLRARNAEMDNSAHDPSAAAHLDFAFHDELVAHCDNEQLLATLRPVQEALQAPAARTADAPGRHAADHDRVIEALADGDNARAAERLRAHLAARLPALLAAVTPASGGAASA